MGRGWRYHSFRNARSESVAKEIDHHSFKGEQSSSTVTRVSSFEWNKQNQFNGTQKSLTPFSLACQASTSPRPPWNRPLLYLAFMLLENRSYACTLYVSAWVITKVPVHKHVPQGTGEQIGMGQ